MSKAVTGGGANSRVNKQVPVRLGGPNKAIAPAWAAQVGGAYGDHAMEGDTPRTAAVGKFAGPALNPTPMGNKRAESCPKGPGGGRTVYRSGYQSTTPSPTPMPPGRGFDERSKR
jgi:hypothetical protein